MRVHVCGNITTTSPTPNNCSDIDTLCHDICPLQSQSCGGRVLRCLTDKYNDLQSKECSAEVFYFLKMEVNDFRNDVILAEACRTDVDRFCKHVQPGVFLGG